MKAQSILVEDKIMVDVELIPGEWTKCEATVVERSTSDGYVHITTAEWGAYCYRPYVNILCTERSHLLGTL